ncbi:TetR/AcrR family transcriptional regulator C-terminal domain-containing protein [Streptomyces bambusae]|uniref:TetR/AcrR family transcriptional regulator C-terminal domain-containing protein n=1 Tax=Streptomyces bambusae TaxID=1550616 RepID=UPI0027E0C49A|nr:TetR/AcrR family transcriptional regulator C-terminal domain-containing protein [Streptomyces bambusae]
MVEAARGVPGVPGAPEVPEVVSLGGGFGGSGGPGLDSWRERLGGWARALLVEFRRHPWLLDATVGARVMGPRELAWMEEALAALDGCGLSGAESMDAVVLLSGHVRGIAEQTRAMGGGSITGGGGPSSSAAAAASGVDSDAVGVRSDAGAERGSGPAIGVDAQLGEVLGEVLKERAGEYPALAAAMASVAEIGGQDQALEFGLERILDGLGLLIEERRGKGGG